MSVPPVLGKEGIWSLVFGQHRFCDGAFLFPLAYLMKKFLEIKGDFQ
jgi:hypothetical protein